MRIWRIVLFLRAVVNIPIQTLIIPPWLLLRKRSPHSWSLGCLCAIQTSNDSITVHLTENLSSCKVVLQLETLLARSFAGRLFASLVVYFAHCWFHLKKKKKASNKKAVFIIPLAWLRYSLFQGFWTQLFIIYFQLKPVIHYSLFSFHPRWEIVLETKFGRFTAINISKYEQFTRKINTYWHPVCPL